MPKLKYQDNVMTAFDFIESHLLDPDLSIKEAAKTAGFFTNFISVRIFCELVGESISDYLKARRLSQAAVELCSSKAILVIALKYGFESQEAFTRTFKVIWSQSRSISQASQSICGRRPGTGT